MCVVRVLLLWLDVVDILRTLVNLKEKRISKVVRKEQGKKSITTIQVWSTRNPVMCNTCRESRV